jgi:hypothetical protein
LYLQTRRFLSFYYVHIRKTYDPLGRGQCWLQGYNLNTFGRDPICDITCQICKLLAFFLQRRRFLKFYYKLKDHSCKVWLLCSHWFLRCCLKKLLTSHDVWRGGGCHSSSPWAKKIMQRIQNIYARLESNDKEFESFHEIPSMNLITHNCNIKVQLLN